jgi:phage repressor protein C with HTH and peptisase S24 domain
VLSHARIWAAIDELAARNGLTASGLARRAGLDPTTFNPSKRVSNDGRQRWPSTESIAKILEATETDVAAFLGFMAAPARAEAPLRQVPLPGLAEAGAAFDDGSTAFRGWSRAEFAGSDDAFALEVTGSAMMPLYRDGDIIIVSPATPLRRGDRVVVKTREGEIMARILKRKTARTIALVAIGDGTPDRTFSVDDVEWVARILWASQ